MIVVFVVYGTFRTIPTVESYGVLWGFSTVTGLSRSAVLKFDFDATLTEEFKSGWERQGGRGWEGLPVNFQQ